MFIVSAFNGTSKVATKSYEDFASAMRSFSYAVKSGKAILVSLRHDHPEYGLSVLMHYTQTDGLEINHAGIVEWAY